MSAMGSQTVITFDGEDGDWEKNTKPSQYENALHCKCMIRTLFCMYATLA